MSTYTDPWLARYIIVYLAVPLVAYAAANALYPQYAGFETQLGEYLRSVPLFQSYLAYQDKVGDQAESLRVTVLLAFAVVATLVTWCLFAYFCFGDTCN
jgi:hypothetical protein